MSKLRLGPGEPHAAWEEWVAGRPEQVQVLCRKFPPFRQYWLNPPGQVVSIYSYSENGTLTVNAIAEDNPSLIFSRRVFGIRPDDPHELDAAVS